MKLKYDCPQMRIFIKTNKKYLLVIKTREKHNKTNLHEIRITYHSKSSFPVFIIACKTSI